MTTECSEDTGQHGSHHTGYSVPRQYTAPHSPHLHMTALPRSCSMGRGQGRGGGQREERGEEQRGGGGGHGGVSLGTEGLHLLSPPYPGPGPGVVTEVALSP